MQLTTSQEQALDDVLDCRERGAKIISLAGPAGTGKTTCLKALVDRIPADVAVVTPTNKAAAVLRNKGLPEADTLYSVFFTPEEDYRGNLTFRPNDEVYGRSEPPEDLGKRSFCDTIVVDEASMLQTWLISHLRRMCNTLILVGDPHQLPPVGDKQNPGGYFCEREHDALLFEVLRQGAGSPILRLATHIRENGLPNGPIRAFAPATNFAQWFDPTKKIVAFTNNNRRAINALARGARGFTGVLPKPGDVLVSNTNTSDEIFNGTELVLDSFSWKFDGDKTSHVASTVVTTPSGKQVGLMLDMVAFLEDQQAGTVPENILIAVKRAKGIALEQGLAPGAYLSYGYCITAHKAQGSEWEEVCVVDERWVLNKVDPHGDMPRRWCYTAFSRASERLIIADMRWFKDGVRAAA